MAAVTHLGPGGYPVATQFAGLHPLRKSASVTITSFGGKAAIRGLMSSYQDLEFQVRFNFAPGNPLLIVAYESAPGQAPATQTIALTGANLDWFGVFNHSAQRGTILNWSVTVSRATLASGQALIVSGQIRVSL